MSKNENVSTTDSGPPATDPGSEDAKASSVGPLALLVLLEWQFTYDSALDQRTLHERDRKVGLELDVAKETKYRLLLYWIRRLSSSENKNAARKLDSIETLISVVLVLSGLLLGGVISAAVFRYDGSIPINVITVLLLCVLLPFFTTLLTLLLLVPESFLRWVPGGSSLQNLLQGVSTARIRDFLEYLLPLAYKKNFEYYRAAVAHHSALYGRMRNWKIVHSAQIFTSSLLIGLLAHFSFLIVSSDLAFGWSTTLGIESSELHAATEKIALPWSSFYPDAVPSEELISSSRFFRFKDGTFGTSKSETITHPDALGAWWPFLSLSIAVYSIAPRLALLFMSALFFRRSARNAVTHHPKSENVLWRMATPVISTQALEKQMDEPRSDSEMRTSVEGLILTEKCIVIDWSQVCGDPDTLKDFLSSLSPNSDIQILAAGGSASIEEDQAVIDKIASVDRTSRIILAVKSWEPPTEEILDFVLQLRAAVGEHTLLFILPLAFNPQDGCSRANDTRMEIWLERVVKLADPWTQIVTVPRSY